MVTVGSRARVWWCGGRWGAGHVPAGAGAAASCRPDARLRSSRRESLSSQANAAARFMFLPCEVRVDLFMAVATVRADQAGRVVLGHQVYVGAGAEVGRHKPQDRPGFVHHPRHHRWRTSSPRRASPSPPRRSGPTWRCISPTAAWVGAGPETGYYAQSWWPAGGHA